MKLVNKTNQDREYLSGTVVLQSQSELQISNTTLINLSKDTVFNSDCINDLIEVDDGNIKYSVTSIFNLISKLEKDIAIKTYPFTDKILPNGKKLYIRVHGIQESVSGSPDTIDFNIPYNACKLTGIEIINGSVGDTCNLKIIDTPEGIVSGTPNAVLNQFGFDVNIGKDYYKRESSYDADLIKDMKIRVEYNSVNTLPVNVYINFILHEVKD